MKNTLEDLNNHLFEQLERLNDLDDMDIEEGKLQQEMGRAKAISDVASKIIANGNLVLDAQRLMDNRESADTKLPRMLTGDK